MCVPPCFFRLYGLLVRTYITLSGKNCKHYVAGKIDKYLCPSEHRKTARHEAFSHLTVILLLRLEAVLKDLVFHNP